MKYPACAELRLVYTECAASRYRTQRVSGVNTAGLFIIVDSRNVRMSSLVNYLDSI